MRAHKVIPGAGATMADDSFLSNNQYMPQDPVTLYVEKYDKENKLALLEFVYNTDFFRFYNRYSSRTIQELSAET